LPLSCMNRTSKPLQLVGSLSFKLVGSLQAMRAAMQRRSVSLIGVHANGSCNKRLKSHGSSGRRITLKSVPMPTQFVQHTTYLLPGGRSQTIVSMIKLKESLSMGIYKRTLGDLSLLPTERWIYGEKLVVRCDAWWDYPCRAMRARRRPAVMGHSCKCQSVTRATAGSTGRFPQLVSESTARYAHALSGLQRMPYHPPMWSPRGSLTSGLSLGLGLVLHIMTACTASLHVTG
jgi:hypothetical protein